MPAVACWRRRRSTCQRANRLSTSACAGGCSATMSASQGSIRSMAGGRAGARRWRSAGRGVAVAPVDRQLFAERVVADRPAVRLASPARTWWGRSSRVWLATSRSWPVAGCDQQIEDRREPGVDRPGGGVGEDRGEQLADVAAGAPAVAVGVLLAAARLAGEDRDAPAQPAQTSSPAVASPVVARPGPRPGASGTGAGRGGVVVCSASTVGRGGGPPCRSGFRSPSRPSGTPASARVLGPVSGPARVLDLGLKLDLGLRMGSPGWSRRSSVATAGGAITRRWDVGPWLGSAVSTPSFGPRSSPSWPCRRCRSWRGCPRRPVSSGRRGCTPGVTQCGEDVDVDPLGVW